jgi:hypothetical protein
MIIAAAELSAPAPGAARTEAEGAALLKLVSWLSPAFPVGSFSYSNGLEFAIDSGMVTDEAELQAWIEAVLTVGSGWNDALLLAEAWRACAGRDTAALQFVAELAEALSPTRERHMETTLQGDAFIEAVLAAWPSTGGYRHPAAERQNCLPGCGRGQPWRSTASRLETLSSVGSTLTRVVSSQWPCGLFRSGNREGCGL